MTLAWNAHGAYGAGVGLLAWALALLVFRLRPDRAQNRFLALTLGFEGLFVFAGGGAMYFTDNPGHVYALQLLWAFAIPTFLAAYLLLVGTLDSPLSAPWRTSAGKAGAGLAAATVWVLIAARPGLFVTRVFPVDYAPWEAETGPATGAMLAAGSLLLLYAVVVALSAYLRAHHGSMLRRQNGFFLLAFGWRDALYLLNIGPFILVALGGPRMRILPQSVFGYEPFQWAATTILVFVLLVTYGILKAQLFDIDLKIKWTLKQGTVAAIFVAAFFIVSEVAQVLIEDETGSAIVGVLGAGLLVFAIAPLQRLADRFSNAAMPGVRDTEEYRLVRKRDVYRAAVESALVDGNLSEKDRGVLATLADELGLTNRDASAIQAQTARRLGGAPA